MRRKDKEITDPLALTAILRQGLICRLGLVERGVTKIIPMNYGYGDGKLFFHSAPEGSKIELLKKNPMVGFEIEVDTRLHPAASPCNWAMEYRCLMGQGKVRFLESSEEKKEGLRAIMNQYSPGGNWVFADRSLDNVTLFELDIQEMSGKESGGGSSDGD